MAHSDKRLTTIKLAKEYMKFSAAHFTIFSAQERERLHGHNFTVRAEILTPVREDGLAFNYRIYKDKLKAVCQKLDEYVLIPRESPYLDIEEETEQYRIRFNNETLFFPKSDTLLLPIRNSTVEEYSYYLLNCLLESSTDLVDLDIHKITIEVSSGPGQSGSSEWLSEKFKKG